MQNGLRSVAVLLIASAIVAGASASPIQRREARGKGEPVLTSLAAMDDFRSAFNRDAGTVRVVLLLSPT